MTSPSSSSSSESASADETPNPVAAAVAPSSTARGSDGSPGRTVRSAREAAGLSLEALAAQTRLSRATLDALERDDFGTLNEPVYARGYYRKCAKVLGLSDVELIAAYERQVGPKLPTAPTKLLLAADRGLGKRGARSSSGSGWRWFWILLIAGLIGGLAYWLRSNPSTIGLQGTSGSGETRVLVSQPAQPAVLPTPAPPAVEESRPTPAATSAESASAAPGPAAEPLPHPPVGGTLATQLSSPPAADAADAGETSLALSFKGTSWVRIEDADGKMLLSGVIQAGDHQRVRGKPPYSVFLGNAPGVTLDYGGKPFDVTAFTKQNSTARFSVPQ